jgi:hypothetical protein
MGTMSEHILQLMIQERDRLSAAIRCVAGHRFRLRQQPEAEADAGSQAQNERRWTSEDRRRGEEALEAHQGKSALPFR